MNERYEIKRKEDKKRITIRLDAHLVDWFKKEADEGGSSYQTRMNEVLHNYYLQQGEQSNEPIREIIREEIGRYTGVSQKEILHRIGELPPLAMQELATFVEYLFFKNSPIHSTEPEEIDQLLSKINQLSEATIKENREKGENLIQTLLKDPIQLPEFTPLIRDDIYESE